MKRMHKGNILIRGGKARVIRGMILFNILLLALKRYRSIKALAALHALDTTDLHFRKAGNRSGFIRHGSRFHINMHMPGWPSKPFNRYITQQFRKIDAQGPTLSLLILAMTKQCGFRCAHCLEWNNLNKPEVLTGSDLDLLLRKFMALGISQVHLSGGEPMNRFQTMTELLSPLRGKIDTWLYTNGYSLTRKHALSLKMAGLTGIIVSIDDHRPEFHDRFRGVPGAWNRAVQAAKDAREVGLMVAYSCCTTKAYTSLDHLWDYVHFARDTGAQFIQFLEPRAVGHYEGMDVALLPEQRAILEDFHESISQGAGQWSTPMISFHDDHDPKAGCVGGARDYVYVDTDGDVHASPFCSQKLFSAFDDHLLDSMEKLRLQRCPSP